MKRRREEHRGLGSDTREDRGARLPRPSSRTSRTSRSTSHAEELDGEAIRKLVAKLGKETVTLAGKTDSKNAEKVKALGEALSHAAESETVEAK